MEELCMWRIPACSHTFFFYLCCNCMCFFQVYGTIEAHDSFPSFGALRAAIRASLNIHSYFYNNHAGISGMHAVQYMVAQ